MEVGMKERKGGTPPLILLLLPALSCATSFQPTALFGDHMVIQATDPTTTNTAYLSGVAQPGAVVVLDIDKYPDVRKTLYTDADESGGWSIPVKASLNEGPFVMTLSSMGESVTARDVWFGTVLMCTGQSNMQLTMHPIYDNVSLIANATTPEIRLFQVPIHTSLFPLPVGTPIGSNWTTASPRSVARFSALCYLTAREISSRVACNGGPCRFGLIQSCLGSTDVQSWMSSQAREKARTGCWAEKGQAPPDKLPPSASHAPIGNTSGVPSKAATLLFNGMIAPLAGYTLGGVLWDQGENNAHYCSTHQYNCLFSTMLVTPSPLTLGHHYCIRPWPLTLGTHYCIRPWPSHWAPMIASGLGPSHWAPIIVSGLGPSHWRPVRISPVYAPCCSTRRTLIAHEQVPACQRLSSKP